MEITISENFQVSADSIWNLLRDFGGLLKWNSGSIESVTVDGEGLGAVRTIGLPGGAILQEKLEAFDDSGRSFSYSFTGKLLLPFENYLATMTVIPTEEESCEVRWESTFDPGPLSEAQAKETIEGVYRSGLSDLRKAAEG